MIEEEGLTPDDMEQMSPEDKSAMMEGPSVKAPTLSDKMIADDNVDSTSLGDNKSSMKYGDEQEYEDGLGSDGKIQELPESKKNEISNFDDATARSGALLDAMAKEESMKKKKTIAMK